VIFVAVGTQFSFDRLIENMDEWAANNKEEVIAQIAGGDYIPQHIQWERFLDAEQYNQNIKNASVFVSHAGMGNIISARNHNTPIIVMNRQFALGEHRNDHQADGLKWMAKLEGVYPASTQQELYQHLEHIDQLKVAKSAEVGNQQLTNCIADFINSDISRGKG
jgi:UDP-N-acetylglucosamine transferase subunit ALG13